MKKIMNEISDIVLEMCHGFVLAHPEFALDERYKIIYKKELNADKVSLISGGGSGHEPAHAGFVGTGMLDAAVCGDIFASPSQIQVYQAIKKVATKKGVLLIIKNYSGDMMNFKNAMYLAQEDGILVDYVKVDDDIAVKNSLYTVGRRGVAGTVFVEKVVGAAAQRGYSLERLKEIANETIKRVKSIGFALTSGTVPASGVPTFEIGTSEIEFGVGIHGEPGIERTQLDSADHLAKRMVNELIGESELKPGGKLAVMINGFGGTPLIELYLLNHSVAGELNSRGLEVVKTFVGNYMTSLEMAGASVTFLQLTPEITELLNDPSDAVGFPVISSSTTADYFPLTTQNQPAARKPANYEIETPSTAAEIGATLTLANIEYLVDAMSALIIKNEVAFNELDSHAGDGDFGSSVAKGFRVLKQEWPSILANDSLSIARFLDESSFVIMENCGGASGPIWGSAFRSASKYSDGKTTLSVSEMAELLQAVVTGIQTTGERSFGRGAIVGDKTLIDALVPLADAWTSAAKRDASFKAAFEAGAKAAVKGADATATFSAKMGRAGTVGDRSIGYPDAGAHALGVVFTTIAKQLTYK